MEIMERKLVTSQCDIIRSCHSFNAGFSLAQMGLIVTQEFSPPVIGWGTQRQPGGRGERMRLAEGYLEFLSCLGGDDCFC